MRGFFYATASLAVMGLAYWAYSENYKTQDALREAAQLQRDIGNAREALNVLEAEWAFQNRPERLRRLAEEHFADLGLLPITPEHFASVAEVTYPPVAPGIDTLVLETVSGQFENGAAQ